jgi:hypothetical protein
MPGTWHELEVWGEAHPVALGIGIFAVGAVIVYFMFSGGSSSGSTSSVSGQPSDAYYNAQAAIAASGNQLAAAQLGAQAQSNQLQASLTAQNQDIAGQVQLATIQGQTATTVAGLQANVANAQTAAQQDIADTASTLTAQVQQAGINAQVNLAQISANENVANTTTAANEATTLAGYNAQVSESSTQAQLAAFNALTSAQEYTASLPAASQLAAYIGGTTGGTPTVGIAPQTGGGITVATSIGALPYPAGATR